MSVELQADQLIIALTGSLAIWLVNDERESRRKWAGVVGLAGQPFWLYSTFAAEQWGMLFAAIAFTVSWWRGFWRCWGPALQARKIGRTGNEGTTQ